MPKPWKAIARLGENGWRAVAVLNVGGVDDRRDNEAERVGEDMTLPPLDLLAPVITANAAAFGRFHRLAVDDARRRLGSRPSFWRAAATRA